MLNSYNKKQKIKMNYKEKVKLAEEAAEELNRGKSIEELKEMLKGKGLYNQDVDKVLRSAKSLLADQYGARMEEHLLAGTYEANQALFAVLDEETLRDLKERTVRKIKADTKKEIVRLAKEGVADEEIVAQMSSRYFTEAEVLRQIENYRDFNVAPKGGEKARYLLIGIPCLVAGLGIVLWAMTSGEVRGRWAGALAIYGGWNIYRAFTPKGIVENA
jgi:hypothetical protein